jgi:hypothetical protein
MTRWILPLAVLCLCGATAAPAKAQSAAGDPFFLYYGYFLPQQAFFASIPKQEDNLRMMAVQRQMTALTDRAGMNDPIGGLGTYDPLRPFGERGPSRMVRTAPGGPVTTHINGAGPTGFFNRTNTHYPGRRIGQMTTRPGGAIPNPAARYSPTFDALGTTHRGMGGMGGMGMGMGGFQ